MRRLERFWSAIESMPGPAAVTAEWRRLLGPEFDLGAPLLRPRKEPAASVPCPQQVGAMHRVVEHGPDDYVGVCSECCPTQTLAKADITVYTLDRVALMQAVARAFDWPLQMEYGEELPYAERITVHVPTAGYRFPVYLAMPIEVAEMLTAARAVVAANNGAFVVLTPTRRLWTLTCERVLASRKALLLPLNETLALDDDGRLVPTRPTEELLAEFHHAVLPPPEAKDGVAFFRTLPGATWHDVRLHFKDNQTVIADVLGQRGVFHCSQMGMASKRNGEPTVQWKLLYAFAEEDGTLTWKSPHADPRNQKRREQLAKILRDFFRIPGDPIEPHGNGWRTRFVVSVSG